MRNILPANRKTTCIICPLFVRSLVTWCKHISLQTFFDQAHRSKSARNYLLRVSLSLFHYPPTQPVGLFAKQGGAWCKLVGKPQRLNFSTT